MNPTTTHHDTAVANTPHPATTVTLTGTGVPHPSPGRAGAGTLVRFGDIALQFDAGRGTVIRLAEAGVEPHALTAQFITHVHSDHLVDLPDVAMTRWIQQQLHPSEPLTVVAAEGTAATFARHMFDVFADDIDTRTTETRMVGPTINLCTFAASATPVAVWSSDDNTVRVEAVAVRHEPVTDAVAYRVTTPSAVIVISGDTRVCDEIEHLSTGADVLVHEACRTTAMHNLIEGTVFEKVFSYHADTVPLGALAQRAGVGHLVLTHLIPQPTSDADDAGFVDDVRSGGFTGPVTVGRDLTTVAVNTTLAADPPAPDPRSAYETTLDATRIPHVGLWRDEGDELTREFYRWETPELPQSCIDAMAAGIRHDVDGIDLSNVTDLLQPGYLPLETGIALGPGGGLSVAILTTWPGATPAMIDWWFAWHMTATERYKLWHPQAHYFAQPRFDVSDVAGLTDRQKYLGNTSWVDEYLGPIPSRLAITFHDPADIGLPTTATGDASDGTAIYAIATDSDYGHELARLVHIVRPTADGCEMRSRFIFPDGTPDFIATPMLDHCWTEMTHLASFLPELYARVTATEAPS